MGKQKVTGSFGRFYEQIPNQVVSFAFGNLTPGIIIYDHNPLEDPSGGFPVPLEGAIEWVKILPNARLFKIPDSGHLPFVERPDIFYPAVEQFLNGNWPDGS